MERKPSARLLIADDHKLLAEACKGLLEPEFEVVGIVTDGRSLVKSALSLKPDVVLLDIAMPHLNGLDAAEQIKHKLPSAKLVFLTMNAGGRRRGGSLPAWRFGLRVEAFRRRGVGDRDSESGARRILPVAADRQRDRHLPDQPREV